MIKIKNLELYIRLFGACIFIGFAWSIWISTPIYYIPIRIFESFISFIISIFLFRRLARNQTENLFQYIYDTGIKILSVSVAVASIAITFTFSLLASSLPSSSIMISKQEIASSFIQATTNLIALFIPLIFIYIAGFTTYLKLSKDYLALIRFFSVWLFIMIILMFLESLVMVLGPMRLFLYSYFQEKH